MVNASDSKGINFSFSTIFVWMQNDTEGDYISWATDVWLHRVFKIAGTESCLI